MATAWDDGVGRASNLLQLLGVDAFGLASMITQAALTARRNRDACVQLAEHVRVVEGLLRRLHQRLPRLRRHPETLRRAYLLVRSCGDDLELRSYLYQLLTGCQTAAKLRAAQEEIDRYILLVPVIGLVATGRGVQQRRTEEVHVHEAGGEDSASVVGAQRHRDDDGGSLIVDGGAPIQLHDGGALPQPPQEHPSPVADLAGNFRNLTILQDGAEASSSHVAVHSADHESEARGCSSSTSFATKKRREDKKKKHWRITRVSPRPIISKATKRRKDIVCYVCVMPRHVASRR